MFKVDYPEIVDGVVPRHRFMSAYEQRVEPPDRQWQYLLFAAEPYETIAFKVRCALWPAHSPCSSFDSHTVIRFQVARWTKERTGFGQNGIRIQDSSSCSFTLSKMMLVSPSTHLHDELQFLRNVVYITLVILLLKFYIIDLC